MRVRLSTAALETELLRMLRARRTPMRLSQQLLRRFGVLWTDHEGITGLPIDGPELEPAEIVALRTVLWGATLAAGAALHAEPPGRRPPLVLVDAATARDGFAVARASEPLAIETVLPQFLPAAFLYTGSRVRGCDYVWSQDRVAPPGVLKVLSAVDGFEHFDRGRDVRVHGDAFLLPPAVRGEGARRAAWMRSVQLEVPRRRDASGPFWRLGDRERWRVDILSWHERLVLAALLGTRLDACVVLGPPKHFPRIGFVFETARRFERTMACVSLDDVPADLRARLESARTASQAQALPPVPQVQELL